MEEWKSDEKIERERKRGLEKEKKERRRRKGWRKVLLWFRVVQQTEKMKCLIFLPWLMALTMEEEKEEREREERKEEKEERLEE